MVVYERFKHEVIVLCAPNLFRCQEKAVDFLSKVCTDAACAARDRFLLLFPLDSIPLVDATSDECFKILQKLYTEIAGSAVANGNPLLKVDIVPVQGGSERAQMGVIEGCDVGIVWTCPPLPAWETALSSLPTSSETYSPVSKDELDRFFGQHALSEGVKGEKRTRVDSSLFGGTFDHLHAGHKLILTLTALLAMQKTTVGISSGALLAKKKHAICMQAYTVREEEVRRFLKVVGPHLSEVDLVKIDDPVGPAGTEWYDTFVLTEETESGGKSINEQREKNGLPPLPLVVLSLVQGEEGGGKLGSTGMRGWMEERSYSLGVELEGMLKRWRTLMESLGVPWDPVGQCWWTKLIELHLEPWRAYHTLKHISEILERLDGVTEKLGKVGQQAVCLAAWFHDAIYVGRWKDNERRSAALFDKFCEAAGLSDSRLARLVRQIIIDTEKHADAVKRLREEAREKGISLDPLSFSFSGGEGEGKEAELAIVSSLLFLDCDLAVLSRSSEGYLQYAEQIRQEYIHVPLETYRKARAGILRRMLEASKREGEGLFSTLGNAAEERAGESLEWEIAKLESTEENFPPM